MTDASVSRSNWVDIARGIGILLVVYAHVARGIYAAHLPIDAQMFHVVDDVVYSFHMPLFFFLSGLFFLKSWQRHGTASFMANKLATLAYPYVLWSLLQGLLEILASSYTNKHATVAQVLSLFWHPRQQFWFLYALFFISVLFALFYHLRPRQSPYIALGLGAIAFLSSPLVPKVGPLYYILAFSVFFALGILPRNRIESLTAPSIAILAGVWAAFGLSHLLIQRYGLPAPLYAGMSVSMAIAVLGIIGTSALSRLLDRHGGRFLAYLGRQSLGIYLMHTIAASGARIILQNFCHVTSVPVHLAAGTIAGVAAPLLMLHSIDRLEIPGILAAPRRAASQP